MTDAPITLGPLLASWHLRTPRYNSEHVAAAVAASTPDVVLTSALPDGYRASQEWLETEQIALPLSVMPWAELHAVEVVGIHEPVPDPAAQQQLRDYLEMYDEGKGRLARVDFAFQDVADLLTPALDLASITEHVIPAVQAWRETELAELGAGPGTAWFAERMDAMAQRVEGHTGRITLVVPVEELPAWLGLFPDGRAVVASEAPSSDATKQRSLLDVALTGSAEDLEGLYHQLAEMSLPEAEYHQANILFQTGHLTEAAYSLEQTSAGDFFKPYYLPGFLLSRLGQFYDLLGKREQAKKMYRGVRALPFAPAVALDVAISGLDAPFTLPEPPAEE